MGGKLGPYRRDAGLTLVELLVVVAILAVLAVGAGIAATGRQGASDLAWFRTEFDTARALAIQSRQSRGLFVATDAISRAKITPKGWTRGTPRPWKTRVTLSIPTPPPDTPQIIVRANGQHTPFAITFQGGTSCQSDGWTGLTCDR